MLATEEKKYLFWLGKSVWSGRGLVVEIGPWLGGSTVSMAAGMRASGHDARARLHAVDNYRWRTFMAARAELPLRAGDSFEPHFLANLSAYSDIVVSHALALPDETVAGDREAGDKRATDAEAVPAFDGLPGDGPIEILFIDGAKSWRGMRHLLITLAHRLEPGALLVCQDFKYWGTYWVPMMMARLSAHVEPVHNVLGGTTVAFRLTKPLSPDTLRAFEDHVAAVASDEGLDRIDHAAGWLAADGDRAGAGNVSLAKVMFLCHQEHVDRAVNEFERIQSAWPAPRDVIQLVQASQYLRHQRRRVVSRPLAVRMAWQVLKLEGAWKKRFGKE